MKSIILLISVLLSGCGQGLDILFSLSKSPATYYPQWDDSIDITINAHNLDLTDDINNYPILIRLDSTNFPDISTKTQSSGADIRFAKPDGTPLPYEVDEWVDSSRGTVWVLVDSISDSTPTKIKMYYNNSEAISMADSNTVFNTTNNFQGVWHLDEDNPGDTGTADVFINAVSNQYNGTDYVTSTDKQGIIGRGQGFDGTEDRVSFGTDPGSSPDLTFSLWLNTNSDSNFQSVIGKMDSTGTDGWSVLMRPNDEAGFENAIIFRVGCEETVWGDGYGGWGNEIYNTGLYTPDEWIHLAGTYDDISGTGKLYVNGSLVAQKINNDSRGVANNTIDLTIGYGTYFFAEFFSGNLDEVRISDTPRSPDWIKLDYETQKTDQSIVVVKPSVAFTFNVSGNREDVTSAVIEVSLNATTDETVEFSYAVFGTSTGSGTDHTLTDGTGSILAGSSTTAINFTVVDDFEIEDRETIVVYLSSPVNAMLGAMDAHTYSIYDNDTIPLSNLLLNNSFEDGSAGVPDNWTMPPEDTTYFSQSTEDAYDGTWSLRYYSTDGYHGNVKQTVTLDTNTDYILRASIKLAPGTTHKAIFDTFDRFDVTYSAQFIVYADMAGEWIHFSTVFNSESYTDVTLRFFVTTSTNPFFSGTAYLDNVSIGKVSSCPDGYIRIPGNIDVGAPDDFCVMKYEAKCWDDAGGNNNGIVDSNELSTCTGLSGTYQPGSHEDVTPWVSINQTDAWDECNSLNTEGTQEDIDNDANGDGTYGMISNPEWMAIARNVENVDSNWTNGAVGDGCLRRGNTGATDACTGGSSQYNGADPEFGSGRDARASHTLDNGEVIWDLSGNVWHWIDWTIGSPLSTDMDPADKPFRSADGVTVDYFLELPVIDIFSVLSPAESFEPSDNTLNSTHGIGSYYGGTSVGAAIRGGNWNPGYQGIYLLNLNESSSSELSGIGFRCVYRPSQ